MTRKRLPNALLPLLFGISLSAHAATHAGFPLQESADTGGDGTVKQSDTNAYSLPQSNLSMTKRLDFSVGNSFFRNPWVEAPASTTARDGLGPLFNTNSCQGCHIKDGRGQPPSPDETAVSLFLRLAVPADPETDAEVLRTHGFKPAPVYGTQLQTAALPAAKPEADLVLTWKTQTKTLADGTHVELREPIYTIENPNYGPLPEDLLISPRVAPPMIGMGLLETIPISEIEALADPRDTNGDGISGKLNQVWDLATGQTVPGRFGWKAAEPDVHQQSMGAFSGDMGLTSSLKPATDCTPEQKCDRFTDGGQPEVSDKIANFVTFYAKSLAVPARRNMDDPSVQKGAQLFNETGCAACHTPMHTTGTDLERPDLSEQTIWPYTDMLLHDMGPALADGRDEFLANGNEWRTQPLWGIGLAQTVNPQAGFLHDGRARTLEEAILWHGGEAAPAVARFSELSAENRRALLDFLNSL
ncbi:di-heme oxidoredictase family protein [Marinobacter sp. F3R11]|uniref:di-heme oxidoreductase family protein n=1 Tax=Marinobacter sp. F3R11 TaxID=2267231 RepID=UPI000DEAC728|nr:di-heme oxidoredictase family protein [Marinobacter sp. F3R11]RBW48413.1 thiol oxidoreductase [Marinobacter sp. F3R11]